MTASVVCGTIGGAAAIGILSAGGASAGSLPIRALNEAGVASLPAHVDVSDAGDGGIRRDTVKRLAESADADYYAGLDDAGNVCLVIEVPESEFTSSACTAPEIFNEQGVGLAVASAVPGAEEYSTEAYLLPDDVEFDAQTLREQGLDVVSENLLVSEDRKTHDRRAHVGKRGSEDFVVPLYVPGE